MRSFTPIWGRARRPHGHAPSSPPAHVSHEARCHVVSVHDRQVTGALRCMAMCTSQNRNHTSSRDPSSITHTDTFEPLSSLLSLPVLSSYIIDIIVLRVVRTSSSISAQRNRSPATRTGPGPHLRLHHRRSTRQVVYGSAEDLHLGALAGVATCRRNLSVALFALTRLLHLGRRSGCHCPATCVPADRHWR